MKKKIFKHSSIIFCVFLISFFNFAIVYDSRCEGEGSDLEVRYGIKVCPVYSIFSIKLGTEKEEDSNVKIPLQNKLGLEAGPIVSFNFRVNHAVIVGLNYFTQGFSVIEKTDITDKKKNKDKKKPTKRDFWVSYANIPLGVEFHSNEFWIDTNLYMLTGIIFCVKISEGTPNFLHKEEDLFKRFKACFIIGAGIEYEFAMNTSVFADLSFRTDLFNTLTTKGGSKNPIVKLSSHTFGISVGIRF